jgi:ubiquinone/menaquinone biosynthesis C-methylase UbiE
MVTHTAWLQQTMGSMEGRVMENVDPTRLLASLYSSAAREYALLWEPVIRPMGERLVRAMPLARAAPVLDVGAGTGALFPALRTAAPHALIVGVDGAEGMLRVARTVSPTTLLVVTDALRLGIRSSAFDAAVLAFMLFLLPDPVGGLVEVARVLRSGGVGGITTWGADQSLPGSAVWDEELSAEGAAPDVRPMAVQQQTLMDTPEKAEVLVERAGLLPFRIWAERFERQWTWEELMLLGAGYGAARRRLDSLSAAAREACLRRVRERLAQLSGSELLYKPEIVFTLARCEAGA